MSFLRSAWAESVLAKVMAAQSGVTTRLQSRKAREMASRHGKEVKRKTKDKLVDIEEENCIGAQYSRRSFPLQHENDHCFIEIKKTSKTESFAKQKRTLSVIGENTEKGQNAGQKSLQQQRVISKKKSGNSKYRQVKDDLLLVDDLELFKASHDATSVFPMDTEVYASVDNSMMDVSRGVPYDVDDIDFDPNCLTTTVYSQDIIKYMMVSRSSCVIIKYMMVSRSSCVIIKYMMVSRSCCVIIKYMMVSRSSCVIIKYMMVSRSSCVIIKYMMVSRSSCVIIKYMMVSRSCCVIIKYMMVSRSSCVIIKYMMVSRSSCVIIKYMMVSRSCCVIIKYMMVSRSSCVIIKYMMVSRSSCVIIKYMMVSRSSCVIIKYMMVSRSSCVIIKYMMVSRSSCVIIKYMMVSRSSCVIIKYMMVSRSSCVIIKYMMVSRSSCVIIKYMMVSRSSCVIIKYMMVSRSSCVIIKYMMVSRSSCVIIKYMMVSRSSCVIIKYMMVSRSSCVIIKYMMVSRSSCVIIKYMMVSRSSCVIIKYMMVSRSSCVIIKYMMVSRSSCVIIKYMMVSRSSCVIIKYMMTTKTSLSSQNIQYLESRKFLKPDFLNNSPSITTKMRGVLMDWLLQVQNHEELKDETLHLCVDLIDRFLSVVNVEMPKLQLVSTLCYLTDNTFVKSEVLLYERLILSTLKFDLSKPVCVTFLDRFLQAHNHPIEVEYLAKYLLDLTITSAHLMPILPSLKAAAALYLSRLLLLDRVPVWTRNLHYYTSYSQESLMDMVTEMVNLLLKVRASKNQGAKNKYNTEHYKFISTINRVADVEWSLLSQFGDARDAIQ
ncbi:G2/mitotic-specific cyclin-B [Biomphalaria pfeifferi]|uniref:G2/mitotic-specific cyclin-B n=1 Tax=Biomphalaria pfeifferi TaxID=112525 RepID=A0AAD8B974_BIOPF|nr:G2/mitotic-specific cyclin-B [Biomphalaria pfeifferi]